MAASGNAGREREVEALTTRLEQTLLASQLEEGGREGKGEGEGREKGSEEEEMKTDSPGMECTTTHTHTRTHAHTHTHTHSPPLVQTQGQTGQTRGGVTETCSGSEREGGESHDWQQRSHD